MSDPLVFHVTVRPPEPWFGVVVHVADDEGRDVLMDVTVSDRGVLSFSMQLPEGWRHPHGSKMVFKP